MIKEGFEALEREKNLTQPIEVSVIAPDGSFELKTKLPATTSRLEQSEWQATLTRITALFANSELFLQARSSVIEISPKADPDTWARILTGMLVPEAGSFLQHGLAPVTREAIAAIIQEKTQNGGLLHLDLGTLPSLKASSETSHKPDLGDWLVLKQAAALKNQLQSSTGTQPTEIQITGELTLADWTEAPLHALTENQSTQPDTAETKLQEIEKIFKNLTEPEKPTESCDFTITTETAAFASQENLQAQEKMAQELALQLQDVWGESEVIFNDAFTRLTTSAENWWEFFQTTKKNQAGPQEDRSTDKTNDYRSIIQAILELHPNFYQKAQNILGFESFGVMTPVWKESFLRQIALRVGLPSTESYAALLGNKKLVEQSLLHLARKIVFAQMRQRNTSTLHYDWNVSIEDSGTGVQKPSEIIPLRVLGEASRQAYDLATTQLTMVDPRQPILTNSEKKLLERAEQVVTNPQKMSVADAETLAKKLAALALKQQQSTLLFVKPESLDQEKSLATTTIELTPSGATTPIKVTAVLQ